MELPGPGGLLLIVCFLLQGSVASVDGNVCSFELDFCSWEQSDQDNLEWHRTSGPTPTRRGGKILTGPVVDHTLGTDQGFYAYLESSAFTSGAFADLITKDSYKTTSNLEFWYYMHGQSMGSLTVLVWPENDPYPAKLDSNLSMWRMDTDMGDAWRRVAVTINSTGSFSVSDPYKVSDGYA
ncbi:MAM domain-containing glycosylphosphatidylinositol anchor protein 1-like [Plakobranchus ocellatus]|uniref:MAM domain-containing glycosylphosphatidylinositol anchor protein 1-like n=1 Tax=Plakobranchus ocellatus TaxID=259542 RepID=A0AAV4E4R1_9GAST|nr:MAM domain-containing glycosylphosphatidylinositol anchor protein 1-like [Plakobranchus ocellatus]